MNLEYEVAKCLRGPPVLIFIKFSFSADNPGCTLYSTLDRKKISIQYQKILLRFALFQNGRRFYFYLEAGEKAVEERVEVHAGLLELEIAGELALHELAAEELGAEEGEDAEEEEEQDEE